MDYVPNDWPGKVALCHACGNDAPDYPRVTGDDPDGLAPRECTPCFIGRVLNHVATEGEARALRSELFQEIRRPSTPWNNEPTQEEQ